MIDRIKQSRIALTTRQMAEWARGWIAPKLLRRRIFGIAIVASLFAALYWGVIASDRYVSEAHVVVQRTDLTGGVSSSSLVGLIGGINSDSHADQLLLRDYLLSVDMMKKLDARLDLRAHYSDGQRDVLSRLWFTSLERFHDHYRSRVSVEFDDSTGILAIKAQGYDPKTAHAIAAALVDEGGRFMNGLAQHLAQEQVTFLEKQVLDMGERLLKARQAVLEFQNRNGLVSPEATTQNYAAIVGRLESQLADLQARRNAMLGYLMSDSPNVADLNLQIAATEQQIAREKARLTSNTASGKTLNRAVEEYQRLQMSAEFAQEVYKTALGALESGRIEATRTLKKVSVLQSPFEPQYAIEPRRTYNTIVFVLVALLIAGVIHLLAAIIRDHQD